MVFCFFLFSWNLILKRLIEKNAFLRWESDTHMVFDEMCKRVLKNFTFGIIGGR
jgi:hypothetical protein